MNEVSHTKSSPYNLGELNWFFEVFYKKLEALSTAQKNINSQGLFLKKMKLIPQVNAYTDVDIKHRPIGPALYTHVMLGA